MEPDKEGAVMYGEFTAMSQQFVVMDSAQNHQFNFNEAVSLMVTCKDQAER
jgi:predicted 3-demethylubiquinone-9 3-methyltransferase (glyoxalase superfamily)